MRKQNNPAPIVLSAQRQYASEVAAQLQKLLLALGHQGSQHLTEVDADLHQTNDLLDEAIAGLSENFLGLHAASAAQQALLATLEVGAPVSEALRGKFEKLQQEASDCVRAAVTALQFQDMTNQLIGRVLGHIASLNQVLHEAGQAGALLAGAAGERGDEHNDKDKDNDDERATQALAVLALVNQMLEEKATIVGKVPGKAVAQTHLQSGDIELF